MNSRIITYLEREKWNDFVANSPNSSVLQSYEWGELKSFFGWRPIRIVLEEGDKYIAGISILKREVPFIRHSLFYAPRGPIIDFANKELLHNLLDVIEKEADRNHAISLKIDPEVSEENEQAVKNIVALGFEKTPKQVQPRATYILDIDRDLDALLGSFEEKTRYNIRLAEKKGVTIKEDVSEKGIAIFHELYKVTATRDKFLVHPEIYYQKIREVLFTAGLGTCFIAYFEDKPIAAVIIFAFGKRIWYMYGASASEYRNVMPNHLLHWEVIKWAKDRGYKEYDLWGIPANPGEKHPLYGVYRFKKGFKGDLVKYIGTYDFPYSSLLYLGLEKGVVWWQNLRSLVTKGKIEDSLAE
ncbi:MAG: peptidoglycan bridge formation glycyltransferase FemA/FemB family protein [Candidatus Margulisbacteria bacterium]|nr:peptidoglycan bridge formation glycyltransferase FemA/FemB family protein [Candidatus Margulisiibacteriota bacterium]